MFCCREVEFETPIPGAPHLSLQLTESSIGAARALLRAYFADPHTVIPPQHTCCGTPYQQRVWLALQQIPVGEVRTYGELAAQLGSSARAVAQACRSNPLTILIPCHRVISATGLGGYMGQTEGEALEIKRWLLHHEGYV